MKWRYFLTSKGGRNVFYQTDEFKTRIIELPLGGQMPACEMVSHVIFYVLGGEVKVTETRKQWSSMRIIALLPSQRQYP
jgi:quercetin dioxygenase-like cupin family protein